MLTASLAVVFPLRFLVFVLLPTSWWFFGALTIWAEAEGTASLRASLFRMVRFTGALRPFQSPVALTISSPNFCEDRTGH